MDAAPVPVHRVIARLNVGGPALHVVNLARGLDATGAFGTTLVAGTVSAAEGDMGYYAEEQGVAVEYVPALSREISPLDDVRALWRLYRIFRRDRPRIVHTHTAKAGTLGRIAALLAGVPVRVHTFHGHVLGGSYFSPARTRFFLEVERQLARFTHRLVVLTERQAREMSEELGVAPRNKFVVIPLGLELGRFRAVDREQVGPEVRRELGLGPDDLAVGIVGRLVPVKNHELWLEAVAALAARSERRVRGVVVGSGEREAELRARAASLGLEGAVAWLGWRRDLPRLYAAMDVLALTSHDEGTPVAVLEALAAGTRVAARDVGGVREVLEGVGAGTVVPSDADGVEWGEVLDGVVAEEAPPPTVRDVVAARYATSRLSADMTDLYEELLTE